MAAAVIGPLRSSRLPEATSQTRRRVCVACVACLVRAGFVGAKHWRRKAHARSHVRQGRRRWVWGPPCRHPQDATGAKLWRIRQCRASLRLHLPTCHQTGFVPQCAATLTTLARSQPPEENTPRRIHFVASLLSCGDARRGNTARGGLADHVSTPRARPDTRISPCRFRLSCFAVWCEHLFATLAVWQEVDDASGGAGKNNKARAALLVPMVARYAHLHLIHHAMLRSSASCNKRADKYLHGSWTESTRVLLDRPLFERCVTDTHVAVHVCGDIAIEVVSRRCFGRSFVPLAACFGSFQGPALQLFEKVEVMSRRGVAQHLPDFSL